MKKALIITYYWPPGGGAGVQRWLKFVKYLRDFGWEPVVFTPENPEFPETDLSLQKDVPEGIEVIRRPIWEPYVYYKRISGKKKGEKIQAAFLSEKKANPVTEKISVWIRGNLFIPDARKFWIRPSVGFLKNFLKKHPIDVIISSGPPHSMHLIALRVAKDLHLPWLADFRDPWTGIDFYRDLRLIHCADRRHHFLEKNVLEGASAITVVSPGMAADLNRICPRNYEFIPNGYDPDDLTAVDKPRPDKKFSLAYIGTLTGSRNPHALWSALKELISENTDFRNDLLIKLVGKVDFSVTESLGEHGLTDFMSKTDYLPHDEVIRVQQSSQVLLLLINDTPNAKSILTGKLFEYMASGRPILCIGPEDGDAANIIRQTNTGLVSGFNDAERTKQNILNLYRDFKTGTRALLPENIEQYSRKALTGRLAEVLDRLSR